MSVIVENIKKFVSYAHLLKGDEKGEAQVFCDRLFQAFCHNGYKEAGAELEFRIKSKSTKGTSYADLIWKPRLILEMKKGGEKLYKHYKQAFHYWQYAVPNRPRYMILCNFREFWIYDFDKQLDVPIDVVSLNDLPKRYTALNFLFPENPTPIFGNDREAVSREAANKVAQLFNSLSKRGISRVQAQHFVLQIVVAMFAEDIDLMPCGTVLKIAEDCLEKGQSTYDLFRALFSQMNSPQRAKDGRFKNVPYFNGGLFQTIEPIELKQDELLLIGGSNGAAMEDWSKVNPAIFGTIFQQSMDADERHAYGAHFTAESDIQRIVGPTIVRPWQERIEKANTMKELITLRRELLEFRVLDPACGSGNFIYVSYRELIRLEIMLLSKLKEMVSTKVFRKHVDAVSLISPRQFYGIDRDSFAIELAKITLLMAKKLAIDEALDVLERDQLPLSVGDALPLDNLDENFLCGDSLFEPWPEVNTIIGNPPYQSKNKIQQELGSAYVNRVRKRFADIDGRADYCVYWFRKTHDHLKQNQRAGLVGTNTIRQNYSRMGGLDYIVNNNGIITEAVSSMKWSGDAAVDVSIVNWIKGNHSGKKRLFIQKGNDASQGWDYKDLDIIGPSLSFKEDITKAKKLHVNASSMGCFQGQTHGHEGFLLTQQNAKALIAKDEKNNNILHPFLIADELIGRKDSLPTRYVIDFYPLPLLESKNFPDLFTRVQKYVLPDRQTKAEEENKRNKDALSSNPRAKVNHHHNNFLKNWWWLSYPRGEMCKALSMLDRYIVCGRVTLRPIFEFVSTNIRPNDALMVFPFNDDYSFGILQSDIHWQWFVNRCSTLTGRYRYTSDTVFDSFTWPQKPSKKKIQSVAEMALQLRKLRNKLKVKHNCSLRELYRTLELPGKHPLKDAHNELDLSVRLAYGMDKVDDPLKFLLQLNHTVANKERTGKSVIGPGLPSWIKNTEPYVSKDCIVMP